MVKRLANNISKITVATKKATDLQHINRLSKERSDLFHQYTRANLRTYQIRDAKPNGI